MFTEAECIEDDRANEMNPRKMHIELLNPNVEKMRTKPLQPPEQPLYFVAFLVHLPVVAPPTDEALVLNTEGRNKGVNPKVSTANASWRVSLPSYARSINRYGF